VPQWDFLNFLADEARGRYPHFELRMRHEATGLVERGARVAGVRVCSPEGESEVLADVVVACDGRHSTLRQAAGLRARAFGAPMDVLWFRLLREQTDPEDTFGIVEAGRMMVMLNRTEYWQTAYVVPKGRDRAADRGAARFGGSPCALPGGPRWRLDSWDDVKTLEVRVDRLERWYRPGLLLIGDAAHAMSPVGGVVINLAIQDAVAAANALAPTLRAPGPVGEGPLRAVQQRRLPPTRLTQVMQLQIQRRIISALLENRPPRIPVLLRWLLRFRIVRHIPARLFGYGLRPERPLPFRHTEPPAVPLIPH
jgi:2-polyprenyl-6-methoxyphenol hydroxylase-like FAD-dependent oxidoreductase